MMPCSFNNSTIFQFLPKLHTWFWKLANLSFGCLRKNIFQPEWIVVKTVTDFYELQTFLNLESLVRA